MQKSKKPVPEKAQLKVTEQARPKKVTQASKSGTRGTVQSSVVPSTTNNQHTNIDHLNGLKYCIDFLNTQKAGRVSRAKLSLASKIRSKEGITKIVGALLDQGRLVRLSNNQLAKPSQLILKLIK